MKQKSERIVEDVLLLLFHDIQRSKLQVAALVAMLERRGVTRTQLRQELRELQGTVAVKRRASAAYRPIRKAALQGLQSAWNVRVLEQVSLPQKLQ